MPGRMEFEFSTASGKQSQRKQDAPLIMQVLGDFGIHENHSDDPAWLMQVPVRRVDLDNIDELWSHFSPRLDIDIDECRVSIEPRDLEDFHPDQLYKKLPLFEELRQTRERLVDPATSARTLAEIMANNPDAAKTSHQQSLEPETPTSNESGDDMFQRLLGDSQRPATKPAQQQSAVDRLLHKAVAAHIVQDTDPKVDSAIAAVDDAIAQSMRKILHHAQFQALEGAWRSLFELVYTSELGEEAILRVCNVSKQDLLAGLPLSSDNMHESGLYQLLIARDRKAADDEGFSILLCNYFFSANADDVALMATLASLAELNDAAILGAAESELIGSPSLAMQPDHHSWAATDNTYWQQLRESPMADRIGLALPRILGRLPYGQAHERVDSFDFEEMLTQDANDTSLHDHFLWVNPTLYLAGLIAKSFTQRGWDMNLDDHTDIGGLPVYTWQTDAGDTHMLPSAEAWLPEHSAEAILQLGLMPLVSFRNRDMARVLRFQSIAEPLAPLKGPW